VSLHRFQNKRAAAAGAGRLFSAKGRFHRKEKQKKSATGRLFWPMASGWAG